MLSTNFRSFSLMFPWFSSNRTEMLTTSQGSVSRIFCSAPSTSSERRSTCEQGKCVSWNWCSLHSVQFFFTYCYCKCNYFLYTAAKWKYWFFSQNLICRWLSSSLQCNLLQDPELNFLPKTNILMHLLINTWYLPDVPTFTSLIL